MTPDHNIFHSCKANFIKNSTEYRVLLSLCSQNQRSIRRAGFVSGWWLFVPWFSQTLCKKLTFFWPPWSFQILGKFWNDLPQAMFLHRQHQQEVIGWYPKTTTKVFAPAINYLNVRPFWGKIFWGKNYILWWKLFYLHHFDASTALGILFGYGLMNVLNTLIELW